MRVVADPVGLALVFHDQNDLATTIINLQEILKFKQVTKSEYPAVYAMATDGLPALKLEEFKFKALRVYE